MKLTALIMTAAMFSAGLSSARTWTSADGSKTFEGEIKSFDATSGKVVVMIGHRQNTFSQEKLSEADRAFLASWEPPVDPAEKLASQKIGKELTNKVLSRIDGKKFRKAEMEKAPEYYLLYFSASW